MRVWLIVGVLVAACGDSHLLQAMQPAAPAQNQLRVMSYNVNFGIAGDPPSIAALAGAHPDIVVLQETNEVWEHALVDALGTRVPHRRFRSPPGWPASGTGGPSTRTPAARSRPVRSRKTSAPAWTSKSV